jgi:phosphatidylglycerol:prolipoprotein diacylglycerol transferase
MGPVLRFPNLGIEFMSWSTGFSVFGIEIKFYGVIIAIAMLVGYLVADHEAKKTGQQKDLYLDFLLIVVITSIIGARLMYVVMEWDSYKDNLWQIFNLRSGGLAIYGGIIAGLITLAIYVRIKKQNFGVMADTACLGLVTGQIIGRWANFMNLEAFGGFTNSFFAMQIRTDQAYYIPANMQDKLVTYSGAQYLQVHPTFLYESLWNLGLLILLLIYKKHKKFEGELILLYMLGYGIGRFWIEGLRTDQLLIGSTGIPISQLLAVLIAIASIGFIAYKRIILRKLETKK